MIGKTYSSLLFEWMSHVYIGIMGASFLVDSSLFQFTGFDWMINMNGAAYRAGDARLSGAPELTSTVVKDLYHSICLYVFALLS